VARRNVDVPGQRDSRRPWRAALRCRGRTLGLGYALIAAAVDMIGAAVLTRSVRDVAMTPIAVERY
jgi:predicted nucleic acid-binding protein